MSATKEPKTSPDHANNVRGPSPSSDIPSLIDIVPLLKSLNSAQLRAVEHDPKVPLQILAGPGSGKTKVLTSRIARLILTHKIPPQAICAVTFTNKAANEMRIRLTKILGKKSTTALQMGTFHSICAKFLRQYSHEVGLASNFTICDADESKKLIGALLKPYKDYLEEHQITITEGFIASFISKAKAQGQSAAMLYEEVMQKVNVHKALRNDHNPKDSAKTAEQISAEVFHGYEEVLKRNNALDFDDLLVYGVKLFSRNEGAVLWCRHILVDEFQDTNTIQYELMKAIAIKKCVTIVGDPDQSIYGWRSAQVKNLALMRNDFPGTKQIFLEQNYRSTAAILRTSLAIIVEDKKRIPKSLHTAHPLGSTPLVRCFDNEKKEAEFIAFEIKRVVANMGGTLRWGDFVILLRFNALSRPIESALQKEGIPCRILGGHKFFERMEVKDILSYLQLVDNPEFNPAFVRSVKVPARGTGDKTLAEIASVSENLKISQLCLVERIHDNKAPDTKPPVKRKIGSFIKTIRSLRKLNEQNALPSEMIRKLVEMLDYENYLRKTQQDWDTRWENVQELITFASEVEKEMPPPEQQADGSSTQEKTVDSPLRQFLQASMLSSEGDNDSEAEGKEKVTISTCHAAKGLEWPVVIIPSVDDGTFPFYRSEDRDEERRLLYVACTRAQALLYLLYATQRQVAGKSKTKTLSDFINVVQKKNQGLFSYDIPRFLSQDRQVITGVLGRAHPDEAEIRRLLADLAESSSRVYSAFQGANGTFSAVSLTGVKVAEDDAAHQAPLVYVSPDALAKISETWMTDFRRPAFSKASKYAPHLPGNLPISASSAAGMFSNNLTMGSAHRLPFLNANRPFQADPQAVANTETLNRQTSSPVTPGQNLHSPSAHQKGKSKEITEGNYTQIITSADWIVVPPKPKPNDTQPLFYSSHSLNQASSSPYSSEIVQPQFVDPSYMQTFPRTTRTPTSTSFASSSKHIPSVSQHEHVSAPNGGFRETNRANAYMQPNIRSSIRNVSSSLNRVASTAQLIGQPPINLNYDPPRNSEDNAPMSVCSSLLETSRAFAKDKRISTVTYDTKSIEDATPPMIPPQRNNIRPQTLSRDIPDPSGDSHVKSESPPSATPQTGVKRRLGMGRIATGYSNKKFKKPL